VFSQCNDRCTDVEKVYDKIIAKEQNLTGNNKELFFWAVEVGLQYEPSLEKWLVVRKRIALSQKINFQQVGKQVWEEIFQ